MSELAGRASQCAGSEREVDMEEAKAFFEAATAMVGGGTPKGKAAGKDEV